MATPRGRWGLVRSRSDHGFTLIELMVVVLVIGILLAIAIPTFLGARVRAQDAVAKESLHISLAAASGELEADISATGMKNLEGALDFVASKDESTGPKVVSITVTDDAWGAAALSDSGTCFAVTADFVAKPEYSSTTKGSCAGAEFLSGGGDEGDGRGTGIGTLDDPGGDGGGSGSGSGSSGTTPYDQLVLASNGLAAYWKLDESGDGEARDSGPNGFNGTYSGGTGFLEASPVASGGTSVRFGGGYVQLPKIDLDWSAGLTFAAWINPDGPGFYDRVLELSNGRQDDNIWLGRTTNQARIAFEVRPPKTGVQPVQGKSGSLVDGAWQLVVATETPAGRVTIFRNGVKVASTTYDRFPAAGTRGENYIGRSAWQNEPIFRGLIDEVSIWTRPLSASEVAELYGARSVT